MAIKFVIDGPGGTNFGGIIGGVTVLHSVASPVSDSQYNYHTRLGAISLPCMHSPRNSQALALTLAPRS